MFPRRNVFVELILGHLRYRLTRRKVLKAVERSSQSHRNCRKVVSLFSKLLQGLNKSVERL